jgi:MSHA biogenesis protein MshQ
MRKPRHFPPSRQRRLFRFQAAIAMDHALNPTFLRTAAMVRHHFRRQVVSGLDRLIALLLALVCLGAWSGAAFAAVTYQAAGTAVNGTTTTGIGANPAWPAHVANDIALLFVESAGGEPVTLSVPNGFAAVPNSPQATGVGTAGTRLTVFWARATSSARPAPRIASPSDHFYAQIITFRGVTTTGNPWDVTGGGVKAAASTSVTVTGVTTTVANALIVQAVARDNDSAAAAFSAQTNAGLTNIVELLDAGTTNGNGGGLGVWSGIKAAAGATGNTTASVTSSINAFITIALKPQTVAPAYQAAGTAVNNATTVSPAWPAHAIGDIALMFVESGGGEPVTLSVPAGFALLPNSPQATGAGTAGTQLTVYWARATSAAMTAPTLTVPTVANSHLYAQIITYRGAVESGNPYNITGGGVKAAASTSVTVTGVTTTVANTLVVQAVARDTDSAAAAFSAETNVNLTAITERSDAGTTTGLGGGFAVWDGGKATAGATGNTTATVTSSINAFLSVALAPSAAPYFAGLGTAVATGLNWPTHTVDDIALLFIESAGGEIPTLLDAQGFVEVQNSPQATGAGTAGTRMTVYWARATSTAMVGPTITGPADHAYAQIITYRGAVKSGNPWDITGGGVKAAASTSVTVTGVTTSVPNTLIVQAVARDNDNAAAAFSAETNANLTGIAERSDAGTTTGLGGGFAVWDGTKATAGATGNTTATVTSSINAFFTIALKPHPGYQAAGAAVNNATTISPAWPAHAIDDVALLFVESGGGEVVTLSVPAGFALVPNSPQFTGATTTGTRMTIFWARATSTAMTAPTVTVPAIANSHIYGQIITYRGVANTGNPWDVTGGGVKAAASTSVTVTGVTTTVANTLIVQAVARDNDNAAAAFSAETNANLTAITERSDAGTTTGLGGGFAVWDGGKATAGATGDTTATVTSSINAFVTIALREPVIVLGPDHVELVHDGSALTCTPRAVTVLACTSAASCNGIPANQYTAGNFSIAMTAIAGASWCSDSLCATALPNPATIANGSTIYLRDPNVRIDRMGGTAGATNTTIQCTNTATPAAMNSTTECDVSYADSGFIFDVPHHVAEVSQSVTVSAVKKADNSLSCTPAFASVSKTVNFKCSYTDPAPATGTRAVRVGGTALNAANNAAAACDATGGNVSLNFNPSGVATTTVIYADVGSMGLSARYAPTVGADAGLVMTGSDNFIAAPKDFAFSAITAGPIGAGNAFSATLTARNNAGSATPNFGQETGAESASLSLGARIQPTGTNDCVNGPCNGTVSGSVTLPWAGGAATASNLKYSEVGQMTLAATLTSASYLGSGLGATGTSATIGDFVPAYFDTAVTQGCDAGSFTYSGQPFTVDVTARNAAGNTTVNYSDLASCTVCSKAVTLYDPTATANFNGTNTLAATAFAKGIGSRNTVAYTLASPTTAPAAITLRAIDASVTPNVTSSGHTEDSAIVRSGRVALSNANGSELLPLPLTMSIQFWAGASTGWTAHGDDTCTAIQASDFAFAFPVATGNHLAACETAVTVTGSAPSYTVSLARPGAGNDGWTDLTLNLGTAAGNTCTTVGGAGPAATTASRPWLQYNWRGAGVANPAARATFGIYRSGPVIHRREMY